MGTKVTVLGVAIATENEKWTASRKKLILSHSQSCKTTIATMQLHLLLIQTENPETLGGIL